MPSFIQSQNSFGMPLQNSLHQNSFADATLSSQNSYSYMPPPFSSENFAFSRQPNKLQSSGPIPFPTPLVSGSNETNKIQSSTTSSLGSVENQAHPSGDILIDKKAPPTRCPSE